MSENTKINSTFQNLINVIKSKVDAKQEPILPSGENIEDKLNELNIKSNSSIIDTIKTITSAKPKVEPYWEPYTWNGDFGPYGLSVWSDGENIYDNESTEYSKKLNKNTNTWEDITWTGSNNFFGEQVWTDGNNIYYSYGSVYILNEEKTGWIRDSNLSSNTHIPWTDGINIYAGKKRLDKINHTWVDQTWYGELPDGIDGRNVWTDGENIYGYANQTHYILNKDTFTWSQTTFNGNFQLSFQVRNIWSDGNNIYYSFQKDQKILNKSTNTWEDKAWNLSGSVLWGYNIWSDGKNIYLSMPHNINQYILRQ